MHRLLETPCTKVGVEEEEEDLHVGAGESGFIAASFLRVIMRLLLHARGEKKSLPELSLFPGNLSASPTRKKEGKQLMPASHASFF